MARYKCSQCGSPVTKTGTLQQSFKRHFCDELCKKQYMKENGGLYDQSKIKPIPFTCRLCGKQSESTQSTRKFCDECHKYKASFRYYQSKHPRTTIISYARRVLKSDRSKMQNVAKRIINYQKQKPYKPKLHY